MPDTDQPRIIAHTLREQIALGELCPGQKLPDDRTLARRFAVSRTTAHRAIRLLQDEDLVHAAHDGAFVNDAANLSTPANPSGSEPRYTATTITDTALDRLYAELYQLRRQNRVYRTASDRGRESA
ncbi:winged helix-turn-helix domain-containing protein [Streptomyces decoyicus]|uniref:winged helix-turn-helix domain-containing protein n=1 Tax=Streptomyces decoyicus TaxID=249567 RepID=UPI00364B36FA